LRLRLISGLSLLADECLIQTIQGPFRMMPKTFGIEMTNTRFLPKIKQASSSLILYLFKLKKTIYL